MDDRSGEQLVLPLGDADPFAPELSSRADFITKSLPALERAVLTLSTFKAGDRVVIIDREATVQDAFINYDGRLRYTVVTDLGHTIYCSEDQLRRDQ